MDNELVEQYRKHCGLIRVAEMAKEIYIAALGEMSRAECREKALGFYKDEGLEE